MLPGPIESAIVIEPLGGGAASESRSYGGWSIVDDERKKPHEAIFLPLEPLETNEASVLRFSLHQTSAAKFKSLIGRFRISLYRGRSNPRADAPCPIQALELDRPISRAGHHESLHDGLRAGEGYKERAARPEEELHKGRAPARRARRAPRNRSPAATPAKPAGATNPAKKDSSGAGQGCHTSGRRCQSRCFRRAMGNAPE